MLRALMAKADNMKEQRINVAEKKKKEILRKDQKEVIDIKAL